MDTVVGIISSLILLMSGTYIAPKLVNEFAIETIKKVNHGLSPLTSFSNKLN